MKKDILIQDPASVINYWKGLGTDSLLEDYSILIETHPLIKSLSILSNSTFIIFDHVKAKYAYVHETIKLFNGFDRERYYLEGWEFAREITFPTHFEYAMDCHRIAFEFIYTLPINQRDKVIFSKDYCYYDAQHKIARCLQKGIVLQMDKKGNIQLTLHLIDNIDHLKKDKNATFVISGPGMKHQVFFFNEDNNTLTNYGSLSFREKEILQSLSMGIGTIEIASSLNLSPHTVDTHRRNMLSKLNCVDTTALVSFCKMVNII